VVSELPIAPALGDRLPIELRTSSPSVVNQQSLELAIRPPGASPERTPELKCAFILPLLARARKAYRLNLAASRAECQPAPVWRATGAASCSEAAFASARRPGRSAEVGAYVFAGLMSPPWSFLTRNRLSMRYHKGAQRGRGLLIPGGPLAKGATSSNPLFSYKQSHAVSN
jgi:hypothetical protein